VPLVPQRPRFRAAGYADVYLATRSLQTPLTALPPDLSGMPPGVPGPFLVVAKASASLALRHITPHVVMNTEMLILVAARCYADRQAAGEHRGGTGSYRSEQPQGAVAGAAHRVVVEQQAADAPVLGQDAGLRPDLLGREDAAHRGQQRIPVQQFQVTGELFHPVDLAAALDLDRHAGPGRVPAHQVDRTDRGRVLAPHQPPALAEHVHLG